MADEKRLNEILDLIEQARSEGDSATEQKAIAAYKKESTAVTPQQENKQTFAEAMSPSKLWQLWTQQKRDEAQNTVQNVAPVGLAFTEGLTDAFAGPVQKGLQIADWAAPGVTGAAPTLNNLVTGKSGGWAQGFTDFYNKARQDVFGNASAEQPGAAMVGGLLAPTPGGKLNVGKKLLPNLAKAGGMGAVGSLFDYNPKGGTIGDTLTNAGIGGGIGTAIGAVTGVPTLARNTFGGIARKSVAEPSVATQRTIEEMNKNSQMGGMFDSLTIGQQTGSNAWLKLERITAGKEAANFYNKQLDTFRERSEKVLGNVEGDPNALGMGFSKLYEATHNTMQGKASAIYGEGLARAKALAEKDGARYNVPLTEVRGVLQKMEDSIGPGWMDDLPNDAKKAADKLRAVARAVGTADATRSAAELADQKYQNYVNARNAYANYGKGTVVPGPGVPSAADAKLAVDDAWGELMTSRSNLKSLTDARAKEGLPPGGFTTKDLIELHGAVKTLETSVHQGSKDPAALARFRIAKEMLGAIDADLKNVNPNNPAWTKFGETRDIYKAAKDSMGYLEASALGKAFGQGFSPNDPGLMMDTLLRQGTKQQEVTVGLLQKSDPELLTKMKEWKLADAQAKMHDMRGAANLSDIDPNALINELTNNNKVIGNKFWTPKELQDIKSVVSAAKVVMNYGTEKSAVGAPAIEVQRVGAAAVTGAGAFVFQQAYNIVGRAKLEKLLFNPEAMRQLMILKSYHGQRTAKAAAAAGKLVSILDRGEEQGNVQPE